MSQFTESMLKSSLYKRTQGKIARQVTCITIAVLLMAAVYQMQYALTGVEKSIRYGVSFVAGLIFLWFSYRIVNYPKFADFLIQVEAEMRKVSWPSWKQVVTSSIVVIVVMFILTIALFGFDIVIGEVFRWIGVAGAELFRMMGIFH